MTKRTFEAKEARREHVPVWIGLCGPSGSGKTYSALRLATGISKVTGGGIFVVDTEARRALSYCDTFRFQHIDFGAPFGSADYLNCAAYCYQRNAEQWAKRSNADANPAAYAPPPTIVIDSASHEHEGPGGYLQSHEKEIARLSKGDPSKAAAVNMLAWALPSRMRQEMINGLLQMQANIVWCFRAKEKIKLVKSDNGRMLPQDQGWQPITGNSLRYEMTLNMLLLPSSGGVPTWTSEHDAERSMMKLPEPLKQFFADRKPLDEALGTQLAQWAKGDAVSDEPDANVTTMANTLAAAAARGMVDLAACWRSTPKHLQKKLKARLDSEWKPIAEKMDKATKEEVSK